MRPRARHATRAWPYTAPAMTAAARIRLSSKKLLLTKWTAVAPENKEKHFIVTRVIEPEPPSMTIERIELQAVHSGTTRTMHWRELTEPASWHRGWV
ncbi:MAG: hypothetical protein NVS9B10_13020 [Nevskia sp.]